MAVSGSPTPVTRLSHACPPACPAGRPTSRFAGLRRACYTPVTRLPLVAIALLTLLVTLGAAQQKTLTFEQIFKNAEPRITLPLPNVTGWANDDEYLEQKKKEGDERQKLYAVNVKTGAERVYRDLGQFKDLFPEGIEPAFPADNNKAFTKLIYAKDGDLYFFNVDTREFRRLTQTPSEEKNPTLSPDGSMVAFTRDNNLFSIDVAQGKEIQYTSDGSAVVYNGWASWVYYEEIFGRPSRYRAFWWSPDSKRIFFYRFDDTQVPVFPLYNANGQHGSLENTRYPKSGDPNPEVRLGAVTAGVSGSTVWSTFDPGVDQYFGTPFWTPDGQSVLVQWMNRSQDTLKVFLLDPRTGTSKAILQEVQPTWVEWFEDLRFLKKAPGFILKSGRDGWNHLYVHNMDGSLRCRLTEGTWTVESVEAIDEDNGWVYFTAKKEASTRTDLYKVRLNGKGLARLTSGEYSNKAMVSPAGRYFVTTYSNVQTPQRMALCSGKGDLIKELGDSKAPGFDAYTLARTEMVFIPTDDGYKLPAQLTLPNNFDPARKYPVIMSIYGGPGSEGVADSWTGVRNQWLAIEGAIQISVDHRGAGHFGKKGEWLMHRNLGKWEMHDYIEVVKWLRAKPYVDSTKMCITGGSYGGYVTCMALTYGSDYFTH